MIHAEITTEVAATPHKRSGNLDVLRFVAAIFIVFLHVPFEGVHHSPELMAIRSVSRWCVPFFFVTMGLLVKADAAGKPDIGLDRILRLSSIFVVSWLIYLPFAILDAWRGVSPLDINVLIIGTNFHLWFLSAAVIALLFIGACYRVGIERLLLPIGAALLLLWWGAEFKRAVGDGSSYPWAAVARQLAAIPLIWIGMRLRASGLLSSVSSRTAAFALCGAILVYGAELAIMASRGLSIGYPQLFGGALLVSFVLPIIAFRSPEWLTAPIAKAAAATALPIYILHPLVLRILDMGSRFAGVPLQGLWLGVVGTIGSCLLAVAIYRLFPPIQRALEGSAPRARLA